jgi:hypothetical protein
MATGGKIALVIVQTLNSHLILQLEQQQREKEALKVAALT